MVVLEASATIWWLSLPFSVLNTMAASASPFLRSLSASPGETVPSNVKLGLFRKRSSISLVSSVCCSTTATILTLFTSVDMANPNSNSSVTGMTSTTRIVRKSRRRCSISFFMSDWNMDMVITLSFCLARPFCVPGHRAEHFVHRRGMIFFFQSCRSVQGFYLSVHHDGDAVAVLGFVEVVGRHEDSHPLR